MDNKTGTYTKPISCMSINLQKSKVATLEAGRHKESVLFMTEPYQVGGKVKLIDESHGSVYSAGAPGGVRSALRIS